MIIIIYNVDKMSFIIFNDDDDKGNKIKFGKINPCPN